MSKRDPQVALRQILIHAREAVALIQGKMRTDLDQDRLLNLALTRLARSSGKLLPVCQMRFKRNIQTCPGYK